MVLAIADRLSARSPVTGSGFRAVTVNVATQPLEVAEALKSFRPDIVFMQETGRPCAEAGRVLQLIAADGSDQCVLSRWPLVAQPVRWPGPWQPPQVLLGEHPGIGRVAFVNVRLALPYSVAALSGNAWYTAEQRRGQFAALRALIADAPHVVVCGDFNALPVEVDLGERFEDLWKRLAHGATFPGWLPAARIDQCWSTYGVEARSSWTQRVPSDHRAVFFDLEHGK